MREPDRTHDAIVIGAGAAGGWAAKQLGAAGLDVLVLDAGPSAPKRDVGLGMDRARHRVQAQCEAFCEGTQATFVDDLDNPYATPEDAPFSWIRARAVGGRMLLWDGVCLRMSRQDFKARASDGRGDDWPLAYDDLESAYDEVEDFIGVRGTREGIAELPDGHFVPAAALNPLEDHFKRSIEARWGERRVIPLRLVASAHEKVLAAARATGRVVFRPDAIVASVEIDEASGRVAGVVFVDRTTKARERARARVVFLCASTIESARLLLNSRSRRFPDGLVNSSGLVGRYLFDHTFLSMSLRCLPPEGALRRLPRPTAATRCYVPRFRNTTSRSSDFARGYGIELAIDAPSGGGETCHVELAAIGEVLPRFDSRVTVDADRPDAWGIPTPRIECRYGENELAMVRDETAAIREMIGESGFSTISQAITLFPPGLSAHEMGTIRMGRDPRTSVLNPFNQAWDCKNLFVTDGSAFVSGGSQNPTMTITALTVRACRRAVAQMKQGEL